MTNFTAYLRTVLMLWILDTRLQMSTENNNYNKQKLEQKNRWAFSIVTRRWTPPTCILKRFFSICIHNNGGLYWTTGRPYTFWASPAHREWFLKSQ